MPQEKPEKQTKPADVDACVARLISEGYPKDQAWAICKAAEKGEMYAGKVSGYAAVFNNVDKQYDVVKPGAFLAWLKANPGEQLPLLWVHKWQTLPMGMTTLLKEDDYGLYYEAEILNTKEGRDLLQAVKSGSVNTASYRHKVIESEINWDTGIRYVEQMDISEISAVTKGMSANPLATMKIYDGKSKPPKMNVVTVEAATEETMEVFKAGLRQLLTQLGG